MGEHSSGASTGDYPEGVPDEEKPERFDDDPVNADTAAEEEILTVPSTDRDEDIPADTDADADTDTDAGSAAENGAEPSDS